MDIKGKGQVFTPEWVVCELLDVAGYWDVDILRRHVMDNMLWERGYSYGSGSALLLCMEKYTCGITDLYLAFMELGFRMLSHKGKCR